MRTRKISKKLTTLGVVATVSSWWWRRRRRAQKPSTPPGGTTPTATTTPATPATPPTPAAPAPDGQRPRQPAPTVDGPPPPDRGRVALVVELVADGTPWDGRAVVTFSTPGGDIELQDRGGSRHEAEVGTVTGMLTARVDTADVVVLGRRLTTVSGMGPVRLDVVPTGTPAIQLGGRSLPITADDTTIGLLTSPPLDDAQQAALGRAATDLGLEPLTPRDDPRTQSTGRPDGSSGGAVLRYRRPEDGDLDEVLARLEAAVESIAPGAMLAGGFEVQAPAAEPVVFTGRFVLHLVEPGTPSGPRQAGIAAARPERQEAPMGERLERAVGALGAQMVRRLGVEGTYEIRTPRGAWRQVLQTIEELTAAGVIVAAEPELAAPIRDASVTLAGYVASSRSTQLDRMDVATAWAITLGDPSTRVATFDRGLDLGSPFVDPATLVAVPDPGSIDPAGVDHGMAVYSVASGQGRDGCWGVAPNGGHAAGKLTSFFGIDYWVALDALSQSPGVRVLSLSHEGNWGANLTFGVETLHQVVDRGVVVVAAAGNAAGRVAPPVPTGRPDCDGSLTAPTDMVDNPLAAHPRVIVVGLTEVQSGGEFAWLFTGGTVLGSNRGDTIDLCAACDGVTVASLNGAVTSTGTSMAAPAVAATVALMLAVRPELTPAQVRSLLCRSADVVSPPPSCSATPGGIELGDYVRGGLAWRPWDDPTVPYQAHDLELGFGRLNVGRAVRYAQSYPAEPSPW